MLLTADDQRRLDEIRAMKRTATLVLAGATAVFVVARILEERPGAGGVWAYVRATAEAAMVGGLADWFAVTALFRHPLGIPIPHTAILPRRKDQLGRTFGSFVQTSFLAPDVLAERLAHADVAGRAATWLDDDAHAELVAEKVASVGATALRALDDAAVTDVVAGELVARLRELDAAPLLGRVLGLVTEDGRHHRLLDAGLAAVAEAMAEQRPTLRRRFEQETPWWLPDKVEERVFERAFAATQTFITEIRRNPDHAVRRHLDERLAELAERLRHDPELARRVDATVAEVLEHPAVADWAGEVWAELRAGLVERVGDPDSDLRRRLAQGVRAVAGALRRDPELAARVERSTVDAVTLLAERYGDEVAGFVESTVLRWDATETSLRVELLLGRDLQIIRINGSVVGGLAGLVIHTAGQLLG